MSFKSAFNLFIGVIFTVILVVTLTTYLNYSLSRKESFEASVQARSYVVGSVYAGTVTELFVASGEPVQQGQRLATLRGSAISDAIERGESIESELVQLNDDDSITLLASRGGIVNTLDYESGSFVPENASIMSIYRLEDMYVQASYLLSPPDYDRLNKGSMITVTFPDNRKIRAEVTDVSLSRDEALGVETIIEATPIENEAFLQNFPVGTPLDTILMLDGRTYFDDIRDISDRILQPGTVE